MPLTHTADKPTASEDTQNINSLVAPREQLK